MVERETFSRTIWKGETVGDTTLRTHLASVRRKLRARQRDAGTYILTVQRRGYRFREEVSYRDDGPVANSLEPVTQTEVIPEETGQAASRPAPDGQGPARKEFRPGWKLPIVAALGISAIALWSFLSTAEIEITSFRKLTEDGRSKLGPLLFDGHYVYFRFAISDNLSVERVDVADLKMESLSSIRSVSELGDYCEQDHGFIPVNDLARSLLLTKAVRGADSDPVSHAVHPIFTVLSMNCQKLAYGGRRFLGVAYLKKTQNALSIVRSKVFPVPGMALDLRWRPDGDLVRFCVTDPVTTHATLWQLRVSGHLGPTPVEAAPEDICDGTWTRDGRIYISGSQSQKPDGELWSFEDFPFRGTVARKLRVGPLVWRSPVSDKSANRLFAIGKTNRFELSELNPLTGAIKQFLRGIAAAEPAFSPDRQKVVFTKYPGGGIWLADGDGSHAQKVSGDYSEGHMAHFSPDGQQFAFMGKCGTSWRIFVSSSRDAQATVPLLSGPDQGVPTWLSNTQIVFGDQLHHDARDREMTIHVLDLAAKPPRLSNLPGSQGFWTPRASPDGKRLIALSYDSSSLAEYDFASSRWHQIGRANLFENPAWVSPDALYAYGLDSSNDRVVFRASLPDRRIEKLADLPTFDTVPSPSVTASPDGGIVFLRQIEIDDLYELNYKIR